MRSIDFYLDIYSPFAYLASHRLSEIAEKFDCAIRYLPIDLKRAKLAAGNTGPGNIEIPPKIRYLMTDLKRWAQRYGLPFGEIPKGKDYSRINKGVYFAQDRDAAQPYVREAYAAVWGRGGEADSDSLLRSLAQTMGWDADEFLAYIISEEADQRYEQTFAQAVECGVFGVPIFIIDNQMWWGNDRLQFVEEYLAETA